MAVTHVVFVGAMPPPLHGQSNINQQIVQRIAQYCTVRIADTSGGQLARSPGYHLRKAYGVLRALAILLVESPSHPRLYISVDGGLGLLYNALVLSLARLLGYEIVCHYHSFSCIDRRSRLMALVVALAGDAAHVFMTDGMRDQFRRLYRFPGDALICSNAFLTPSDGIERDANHPLRIGLISNLTADKGLYEFLDLLRAARQLGLPLQGILAGPPVTVDDAAAIAGAQRDLGGDFDFRGPAYGEQKARFFADIDVFVFPTRYIVEAQPLVVFEALAAGVPVIAFGRGCIPDLHNALACHVVPRDKNFVDDALVVLTQLSQPDIYAAGRRAALAQGDASHRAARVELGALIERLCAGKLVSVPA